MGVSVKRLRTKGTIFRLGYFSQILATSNFISFLSE
jgi:hypothetical protein